MRQSTRPVRSFEANTGAALKWSWHASCVIPEQCVNLIEELPKDTAVESKSSDAHLRVGTAWNIVHSRASLRGPRRPRKDRRLLAAYRGQPMRTTRRSRPVFPGGLQRGRRASPGPSIGRFNYRGHRGPRRALCPSGEGAAKHHRFPIVRRLGGPRGGSGVRHTRPHPPPSAHAPGTTRAPAPSPSWTERS